jgi:hypothetical protein
MYYGTGTVEMMSERFYRRGMTRAEPRPRGEKVEFASMAYPVPRNEVSQIAVTSFGVEAVTPPFVRSAPKPNILQVT